MDRKAFAVPLSIETAKLGQMRTLSDTAAAAEFLMSEWPGEKTPEHMAAMAACLAVLSGDKDSAHARVSLIEAAHAAGVFVRDEPRSERR